MNNALWGNRQPTGFWLREFRFEPWRGSRSADPKRTLPGGLTAGLLILDQVGGGSNPPWAASRIPLCGVNRPRGSGFRRWRSRSMFDTMAPFQDRRHNALIAQSGQSGCLVSSVRRRFESGLGLSCAFGCCRHSSVAERFLGKKEVSGSTPDGGSTVVGDQPAARAASGTVRLGTPLPTQGSLAG